MFGWCPSAEVREMVAEADPLIDFFESFSDLRMRHQRVGLFGEGSRIVM